MREKLGEKGAILVPLIAVVLLVAALIGGVLWLKNTSFGAKNVAQNGEILEGDQTGSKTQVNFGATDNSVENGSQKPAIISEEEASSPGEKGNEPTTNSPEIIAEVTPTPTSTATPAPTASPTPSSNPNENQGNLANEATTGPTNPTNEENSLVTTGANEAPEEIAATGASDIFGVVLGAVFAAGAIYLAKQWRISREKVVAALMEK